MDIYFCNKDYEEAIDEFLYINETFPILEKNKDNTCKYCGEKSEYVLKLKEKTSK